MADNYENVFSLKNGEIQSLLSKKTINLADIQTLFPTE